MKQLSGTKNFSMIFRRKSLKVSQISGARTNVIQSCGCIFSCVFLINKLLTAQNEEMTTFKGQARLQIIKYLTLKVVFFFLSWIKTRESLGRSQYKRDNKKPRQSVPWSQKCEAKGKQKVTQFECVMRIQMKLRPRSESVKVGKEAQRSSFNIQKIISMRKWRREDKKRQKIESRVRTCRVHLQQKSLLMSWPQKKWLSRPDELI